MGDPNTIPSKPNGKNSDYGDALLPPDVGREPNAKLEIRNSNTSRWRQSMVGLVIDTYSMPDSSQSLSEFNPCDGSVGSEITLDSIVKKGAIGDVANGNIFNPEDIIALKVMVAELKTELQIQQSRASKFEALYNEMCKRNLVLERENESLHEKAATIDKMMTFVESEREEKARLEREVKSTVDKLLLLQKENTQLDQALKVATSKDSLPPFLSGLDDETTSGDESITVMTTHTTPSNSVEQMNAFCRNLEKIELNEPPRLHRRIYSDTTGKESERPKHVARRSLIETVFERFSRVSIDDKSVSANPEQESKKTCATHLSQMVPSQPDLRDEEEMIRRRYIAVSNDPVRKTTRRRVEGRLSSSFTDAFNVSFSGTGSTSRTAYSADSQTSISRNHCLHSRHASLPLDLTQVSRSHDDDVDPFTTVDYNLISH